MGKEKIKRWKLLLSFNEEQFSGPLEQQKKKRKTKKIIKMNSEWLGKHRRKGGTSTPATT